MTNVCSNSQEQRHPHNVLLLKTNWTEIPYLRDLSFNRLRFKVKRVMTSHVNSMVKHNVGT